MDKRWGFLNEWMERGYYLLLDWYSILFKSRVSISLMEKFTNFVQHVNFRLLSAHLNGFKCNRPRKPDSRKSSFSGDFERFPYFQKWWIPMTVWFLLVAWFSSWAHWSPFAQHFFQPSTFFISCIEWFTGSIIPIWHQSKFRKFSFVHLLVYGAKCWTKCEVHQN